MEKTEDILKNKILKALNSYDKKYPISLFGLEDIVTVFSNAIKDKVDLEMNIELAGTVTGIDFWLQIEYFSSKLQKTIIFEQDWTDVFTSLNEFSDSITKTEMEVRAFEKRITLKKNI